MADIMNSLGKYVPYEKSTASVVYRGQEYYRDASSLVPILMYGDQLTVARARSAAVLRCSHLQRDDRLQGLVPVIADWHARMRYSMYQLYAVAANVYFHA